MKPLLHPKRLLLLVLAGIFLGVVLMQLLGWLLFSKGLVTIVISENILGKHPVVVSATTTPPLATVKPIDRTRPIAVMIDNHPGALPQSGINQAAAVWEAPVEGALTRLMAIFRGGNVPEIGPVRSARPYFLDWAAGSDAVYAHVGGSDEALTNLGGKFNGLDDANEFKNGSYFWRDSSRSAPHNAYTSTNKMRALISKKGWRPETDRPDLSERGIAKPEGAGAETIKIRHSAGGMATTWKWDAESESYLKSIGGQTIAGREGEIISASTIVALELKQKKIADPYGKGLIGIETIGQGPATVFRDGVKIVGKWHKASVKSALTIKDANGRPIPFRDGLVWYEVVLTNNGGTIN